jgi:hypothetical protein
MLHIPFFAKKKSTQSIPAIQIQKLKDTQAAESVTEMRQLTSPEYDGVAGGPEMNVGDGGG